MLPAPHSISAPPAAGRTPRRTGNLIVDHYDTLCAVAGEFAAAAGATSDPAFALPALTPALRTFYAAATVSWQSIGTYRDQPLTLFNLAHNPGTDTTKTFASLLIVARAIRHIRRFGEPMVLFTATSANKGTALRDAVHRAISAGLVEPDELRVVVLAPAGSAAKLRAGALATDPRLAARNPLLMYDSRVPEDVKTLARTFTAEYADEVRRVSGARLWYTLALDNYLLADVARALFEHSVAPAEAADRHRTHVHAVSSAFGMLGYHRGRDWLENAGLASPHRRPQTLLVQHLSTPDMVLHLRFGAVDRAHLPTYRRDSDDGRYRQTADPHFPAVTADPAEVLDGTFYTHRPVTAPAMSRLINTFGGDGIVVSADECRARYPMLRETLADAGFAAPADPDEVREWSLVMALTGALNAIDRGLVETDHEIVVHGSGWYTAGGYDPIGDRAVPVGSVDDIARAVLTAPTTG